MGSPFLSGNEPKEEMDKVGISENVEQRRLGNSCRLYRICNCLLVFSSNFLWLQCKSDAFQAPVDRTRVAGPDELENGVRISTTAASILRGQDKTVKKQLAIA